MEKILNIGLRKEESVELILMIIFFFTLIICNLHLFGFPAQWIYSMIFDVDAVNNAEYWRIFTHIFTHISWVHFILDFGAFLIVWNILPKDKKVRMYVFLFSSLGSILVAWAFSPFIASFGMCGLSGVVHGMLMSAGIFLLYELGNEKKTKQEKKINFVIGFFIVGAVCFKTFGEINFNLQPLQSLYLGRHSIVISHAHLGGIIGGGFISFFIIIYNISKTFLCHLLPKRRSL